MPIRDRPGYLGIGGRDGLELRQRHRQTLLLPSNRNKHLACTNILGGHPNDLDLAICVPLCHDLLLLFSATCEPDGSAWKA